MRTEIDERNSWVFQVEKEGAGRRMKVFVDASNVINYPPCVLPDDALEIRLIEELFNLFEVHGTPEVIRSENFDSAILPGILSRNGIKYETENPEIL